MRRAIIRFIMVTFVIFGMLVLPISILYLVLGNSDLESKLLKLEAGHFVDAAVWLQSVVAWLTLFFVMLATLQIYYLSQQARAEKNRVEREAYRILISPSMQSSKRLITITPVRKMLKTIEEMLRLEPDISIEECRYILEKVRVNVDLAASKEYWPLLPDNRIGFDNIEALINEYTYLSKMIEDGVLAPKFVTELGYRNLINTHRSLSPIIELRRRMSKEYAVHFSRIARKWERNMEHSCFTAFIQAFVVRRSSAKYID